MRIDKLKIDKYFHLYSNKNEVVFEEVEEPELEKIGKWIGHKLSNGLESMDKDTCSECGQRFYQIAETGCLWNYCPNCGAKMEAET